MNQQTPPSILIVTGESSGELYAAQVVTAVSRRALQPAPVFYGSGGDAMRAAGVEMLADVSELAAIGPLEALKHAGNYRRLYRDILHRVERTNTRVALLVDLPDFNLLLARAFKRRGVTVVWYISPTVWAWRSGRIRPLRRRVDRMLCIFPFEEEIYRRAGVPVEYVGHPLLEVMEQLEPPDVFAERCGLAAGDVPFAVLPGSRSSEIRHILPPVLDALEHIKIAVPTARFVIPTPSAHAHTLIQHGLAAWFGRKDRKLVPADIVVREGTAASTMANCRLAITKSGTSTLLAALANTPFLLVYRVNPLLYLLARLILRIKHIGIVNLIAGREITPELIQGQVNGTKIAEVFLNIFRSPSIYGKMRSDLQAIKDLLGARRASEGVADALLQALGAAHRL